MRITKIDTRSRCGVCHYWKGEPGCLLAPVVADQPCRRRAPIVTGGMMSTEQTTWPMTARSEWCGEFLQADDAELERRLSSD